MLTRRSDFALERDALERYLPWLVAFMVFLAALALAGTLVLGAAAGRWEANIGATLTVQLRPTENSDADRAATEAALSVLRAMPEVKSVESLSDSQLVKLVEPWLGAVSPGDLPLPRLIDVEAKPGQRIDADALRRKLNAVAPGSAVDDHRVWLARLVNLVRAVEALAFAVMVLVAAATVGTVIFTTRTGLAIHREAIEVLHLIGAQDSYVANQFAGRVLGLGLKGGVVGLLMAGPTIYGVWLVMGRMEGGMLPDLSLGPLHWAAIAALPVAVAVIATATARLTVLRTLAKML